jgi:hypothetical protein
LLLVDDGDLNAIDTDAMGGCSRDQRAAVLTRRKRIIGGTAAKTNVAIAALTPTHVVRANQHRDFLQPNIGRRRTHLASRRRSPILQISVGE